MSQPIRSNHAPAPLHRYVVQFQYGACILAKRVAATDGPQLTIKHYADLTSLRVSAPGLAEAVAQAERAVDGQLSKKSVA